MRRLQKQICAALEGRMKGRKVPVPEAGGPLLDAFLALSRARSCGPVGPNPISWQDLAALSQVMRMPIEPRHAEIIMALDEVWLQETYRDRRQPPESVKTLPPVSQHPISAALLDVMMG